jgi:hypothetical protein
MHEYIASLASSVLANPPASDGLSPYSVMQVACLAFPVRDLLSVCYELVSAPGAECGAERGATTADSVSEFLSAAFPIKGVKTSVNLFVDIQRAVDSMRSSDAVVSSFMSSNRGNMENASVFSKNLFGDIGSVVSPRSSVSAAGTPPTTLKVTSTGTVSVRRNGIMPLQSKFNSSDASMWALKDLGAKPTDSSSHRSSVMSIEFAALSSSAAAFRNARLLEHDRV